MNNIVSRGGDRGVVVLHQCGVGQELGNGSKEVPVCLVSVSTSGMKISES